MQITTGADDVKASILCTWFKEKKNTYGVVQHKLKQTNNVNCVILCHAVGYIYT